MRNFIDKHLRALTSTFLLGLILSLSALIYSVEQIKTANHQYHYSISLSDTLRQTSDDLTRMVRTYVVTRDIQYKRHFQEILDIRNGVSPRPKELNGIYWDLVLEDDKRPMPFSEAISLEHLMHSAEFTHQEFELLQMAQHKSDRLAELENNAMRLMENSAPLSHEHQLAINMLYSKEYHEFKKGIMQPIAEFQRTVLNRTTDTVNTAEMYYNASLLSLLMFLLYSALAIYRSFTLSTQANLAQKSLVIELENKKQQQDKLFAIISHELRTPVSIISLIIQEEDTIAHSAQGDVLRVTADHLLSILDEMQLILNPENSNIHKIENAKLSALVKSIIDIQAIALRKANINIHVEHDQDSQLLCHFNVHAFRQILLNLIKNSVSHSRANHIDLSIQAHRNPETNLLDVNLYFHDNGIGISPAAQKGLFEAFVRGDSQAEGTGLRLYLCKKLATEHLNGTLTYDDSHYHGAHFILNMSLPIAENQQESSRTTTTNHLPLKGLKVLYAEDIEIIASITQRILEMLGCQVTTVHNGKDALQALESKTFDFVLTDIFMPNMNGDVMIREMRSRGIQTPTFGITAAKLGSEASKLMSAGAQEVLIKPLNNDELIQAVYQHLPQFTQATANKIPEIEFAPDITQPAQQSDSNVMDYEQFSEMVGNNQAIIRKHLLKAAERFIALHHELMEVCTQNDFQTCHVTAHSLKGIALNVFAEPIAQTAQSIENTARNWTENKADFSENSKREMHQKIEMLHQQIQAFEAFVQQKVN